jgi:hypothetical protein
MPTTIKNIIAGTIAIVILLAAFFIFLHFYKINTKQESHHGGCCCCCGGSGGMNGGTGGGSISGPGKFGNPNTIIMPQSGIIDINMDPRRTPQNPSTSITISLTSTVSVGIQLSGTGLTTASGVTTAMIASGSTPQTFIYPGSNGMVDWTLTWIGPPSSPVQLMTNQPPGSGGSDYSGTYSFMTSSGPASATVYITSN